MNIAKLQAQLQKVPDQALIGYVQNPDGQVPSFLALAELTRRKEMRQSAAPQQAAPTQTVAQQMVAEAEPGIAQLPVREDMFNEQSMAAGGIVAFEDGGEVKRFAGPSGSYVQGLKPLLGARDYSFSLPTLPSSDALAAYLADPQSYLANPQQYKAVAKQVGAPEVPKAVATQPVVNPQAPAAPAAKVPPMASTTVARPQADVIAPPASPFGRVEFIPGADLSGEYDTMMRPEVSAQEAMAKYQGLLGTDVGRQKMQERLAGMEAKAAKEETQAPWMALAEAGLGMASGKSQFALQNIAEGGKQGIKSFVDAKDRLVKAEERRFDMASKISQAERAEQVAAATYGLQSEEATKARNEANKLAKLGYKADRESSIAKGNFEASKANVSTDVEMAKIAEDKRYHDLWYKTNMEKTKRDAVTLEKSIMSNNTTQLKTLMSESGKLLKEMMDAGKDSSDPLYASTLRIYNGAADAMGLKAGIDTTVPPTGPRKKPLSAF